MDILGFLSSFWFSKGKIHLDYPNFCLRCYWGQAGNSKCLSLGWETCIWEMFVSEYGL